MIDGCVRTIIRLRTNICDIIYGFRIYNTHTHTYGFGEPQFTVGDSKNVLPLAIQFFFFFIDNFGLLLYVN
jgi:hypothetical protein